MSFVPPPSKQDCPINELTDAELSAIFKHLPPYERLLASEVCRRWHGISRAPWRDVTALDLSPIPGEHIRAIIKQCSNLQSVFARGKSFSLDELSSLPQSVHLSCVKLYDCKFAVVAPGCAAYQDAFPRIFSENLQHAAWDELVLHDERTQEKKTEMCGNSLKIVNVFGSASSWWRFSTEQLPASLTRLQLSGRRKELVPPGLRQLQNLQCLILTSLSLNANVYNGFSERLHPHDIVTLQNLKELFVGPAMAFYFELHLELLVSSLPQLQVLFAIAVCGTPIDHFPDLITKRSALRILVLGNVKLLIEELRGVVTPIEIPARKRFPNGSDPLPLLHVFVSPAVLQKLHFAPSDAAIIHPIDAPMPVFLERGDISPIFKGVWIAKKIKESAKYGAKLWD